MFHRGRLSLTLVQNFFTKFCKENDSLMNWNEIKDCLCLICLDYHLGVFTSVSTFISATVIFRKSYK
jgi:hypothetical protein